MHSSLVGEIGKRLLSVMAAIAIVASSGLTSVRAETPAWSNDFDLPVPPECTVRAWIVGFNTPYTEGWEVQVNINARITALGIYDAGYSSSELPDPNNVDNPNGIGVPGVAVDTAVGMWNASGELLAQAVIPAGDSAELLDRIRYVSITPIEVSAGEHLTLARWGFGDWPTELNFESFPNLPIADYYYTDCWFRFSGDLTHVGGRYVPSQSLTYPSTFDNSVPYLLVGAVNFLYQATNPDSIFGDGFE